MPKTMDASIEIETSFYSDLSRMNITVEEALKEFIDNSTTSFEDHRSDLENVGEKLCKIQINWTDDEMTITDNAYGMEMEEFQRALRLSSRAEHYSENSRGQYGIGLKNAAANIGRKYSIESEQLKSSNRYYAEMDLDDLEVTKKKTIPVTISGSIPEEHKTVIRITKLSQPFNDFNKYGKKADQLDKLLSHLGKAYSKDIRSNKLEIVINDRKVEYVRPKMLKNKDTGSEYIESFEGSFNYKGTNYKYNGWIGILKTGDTADAGLTLMQKDRAIQLNYRPEELFGRSNDFRYQRVVGEIIFEGNQWNVSFAKNRFQWEDNGLEDAFIADLKQNQEVMKLFNLAKKYRKENENVSSSQIDKINLDKTFSGLSSSNSKKETKDKPKDVTYVFTESETNNKVSDVPDNTYVAEEDIKNEDAQKTEVPISYNGENYTFIIVPDQNGKMSNKWISTSVLNKDENVYELRINARVSMFDEYTKKGEKALIVKMAVAVALAQLSSKRLGLKENQSQIFVNELNDILIKSGKGNKDD